MHVREEERGKKNRKRRDEGLKYIAYVYVKYLTDYLCCFRFVTEEHSEHGHYVIAINGVYESVEDQQYWAFMKVIHFMQLFHKNYCSFSILHYILICEKQSAKCKSAQYDIMHLVGLQHIGYIHNAPKPQPLLSVSQTKLLYRVPSS